MIPAKQIKFIEYKISRFIKANFFKILFMFIASLSFDEKIFIIKGYNYK